MFQHEWLLHLAAETEAWPEWFKVAVAMQNCSFPVMNKSKFQSKSHALSTTPCTQQQQQEQQQQQQQQQQQEQEQEQEQEQQQQQQQQQQQIQ